ncbi:MAG TPA: EscU/YscU/HrcU family type III secretion system export apparatus switch protein [Pseudoneobacillus sp.]|nr:EscU/YscU/HrcU family type III secretion system export apparatus switch protein [Pseudoneobacillus sp.]
MIEKKRKEAIALGYKPEHQDAPTVIAKGTGLIADNIIHKAKESGIPVQEDSTLVQLLSQLEINDSIPDELYQVVAEVFAFIYRADQNIKNLKSS